MGATYRTFYSDGFEANVIGIITGTATAVQFPNIPGQIFRLKAYAANKGSFFLGSSLNNEKFELDASEDTDWFKLRGNLNVLSHSNSSGSSDYLAYWVQK